LTRAETSRNEVRCAILVRVIVLESFYGTKNLRQKAGYANLESNERFAVPVWPENTKTIDSAIKVEFSNNAATSREPSWQICLSLTRFDRSAPDLRKAGLRGSAASPYPEEQDDQSAPR
jgi:hypothetical protein